VTTLRQRLIDLYGMAPIASKAPIDDVHNSPAYQALCREHAGDRVFDCERQEVEDIRRIVDSWVGTRTTYVEQVEFALRLIRRFKKEREHETARALILASYGARWDAKQQTYFSEKSQLFLRPCHYFLSFTNRNPSKGKPNIVNLNHRYFVSDMLRVPDDQKGWSERNLVAETIHYLLTNAQLDGFYYPEHEGDNQIVETKLRTNCERALAFVQLVQGEMFRYYDKSPNWCYFEYTVTEKIDADRILFVQLEDQISGDDVYIQWDPWYKRFASKDPVKLKATQLHNPQDVDENVKQVAKLKAQIDQSINRIYQGIPA
jgi:hypothetical protein